MRTHKQLAFYQSILDTLSEPGCPFCRFLKDYQAARLQHHSENRIRSLCNFHTWGLAAVQNALTAAQVFIDLVESASAKADGTVACDLCQEISAEEDRRIREFVGCVHRRSVVDWLRQDAVLCIPHGVKLRRQLPLVLSARVETILEKSRRQLVEELETLRNTPQSDRPGWGALGRAAEFLVAQRGLHE